MFKLSTEDRAKRHGLRHAKTIDILKKNGARRVLDIGCAEGKLLKLMASDNHFTEIVGIDPNTEYLAEAKESLGGLSRVKLIQGFAESLDGLFKNYDAVTLVEVIEHMPPNKLPLFTERIFNHLSPKIVVVTTPVFFPSSQHKSRTEEELFQLNHYFEWTLEEFGEWAKSVGEAYGYKYEIELLEFEQENRATQIAVFSRGN